MTDPIQKITPYLWVEKDAKAVVDYYLSIFKNGKLKDFRKFDSDESGNDAGIETAVREKAMKNTLNQKKLILSELK